MDEETISKIQYHLHSQEQLKDSSHALTEEKEKQDRRLQRRWMSPESARGGAGAGSPATEVHRSFLLGHFCDGESLATWQRGAI